MGCPCAAIMGSNEKGFMAKMAHHLNLIQSHRSKRVILMARTTFWLARIAVPSEVRQHHGIPLGKPIRDFVPDEMSLRISMKKE